MPLVHRQEALFERRAEPMALLDVADAERELQRWDFAIVVTAADLISHYRPYALAVLSRALEAGVISTWRLDPHEPEHEADSDWRIDRMAQRLEALFLHIIGRRLGLEFSSDEANYLFDPQSVEALDAMRRWSAGGLDEARRRLAEIADVRVEEEASFRHATRARFYLRSLWVNRREIVSAVWEARPWQFPFRLSRLTTAATSTMLVLLMTAEAWDLGMTQSVWSATGASLALLLLTTLYVLFRQQLVLRRDRRGVLSEQLVVKNVSSFAVVLGGMLTTYLLLFAVTLAIGFTFYSPALIEQWAASVAGEIGGRHRLLLAAFIASVGIFTGALGASFESQSYFRYVTYVDEET